MIARVGLALSFAFFVAVGCSTKSSHPADEDPTANDPLGGGVSGGGHGSSGSSSSGTVDGGLCNTIDIGAVAVVTQQEVAEAAPVPIGGTIADGTYSLTKDTIYTGPGGTTGSTAVTSQEVQVYSGGTIQILQQPASPAPSVDTGGTYVLTNTTSDAGVSSGFTLTFSLTCPAFSQIARSYSVVNSSILEFIGSNEVLTYTLQ